MILVDTSVWIDHLRKADPTMLHLLTRGNVLCHPLVIGEIAVGSFKNRDRILGQLELLPVATVADHHEALRFISHHKLFGLGIGYIDVHLLASVRLTPDTTLWSRDKRLAIVAQTLRLGSSVPPA
jgi:hypothetical protein